LKGRLLPRSVVAVAWVLGAVNLYCLAPSVHVHDAGELTAAAWTLGLGHPPGAPLYMLLAKAFMTLVPYGNIAWRANLMSAVLAVALFLVLAWWAGRRGLPEFESIVLAAAVTLSPVVWSQSVMAEVYTLQALLLALVLAGLDLHAPAGRIAVLWGLLLACHVGLAPLTPVILTVLAMRVLGSGRRIAEGLRLALVMAVPLSVYAYVPLRGLFFESAVNWGRMDSMTELWWYLSNQNVRARAFDLPVAAYLMRVVEYGMILVRNCHLMLPLAVVGAAMGRIRPAAILASSVVVYDALFVVLLDTSPLQSEAYGIPAVVALAFLAGLGVATTKTWLPTAAALTVAVGVSAWFAWGEVNLSESFVVRDAAESILDQSGPGAVLFTQEDNTTFALAYLVAVEGGRPDLVIFDRAGNLFRNPYDRPLHRVSGELALYRKASDDVRVTGLLEQGREVVFSEPFLEFEPDGWRLVADGTVGRALALGRGDHPRDSLPPRPRRSAHPDWMSRQVLAMDAVKRAASLIRFGDGATAVDLLTEARNLADIRELHLRIAQLALAVPAADLAVDASRAAAADEPDFPPALTLLAQAHVLQGRWEEAEAAARRAALLAPDLPQPWFALGLVDAEAGRLVDADVHFTRAMELGGVSVPGLINRALVRERLGDLPGARDDLDSARIVDPKAPVAVLRLRVLSAGLVPRPELAREVCQTVYGLAVGALSPGDLTQVLLAAARAGAPLCVEEWLSDLDTDDPEAAQVAAAYRAGVNGSGR
jgi:Flp pilus assembly protein TadD